MSSEIFLRPLHEGDGDVVRKSFQSERKRFGPFIQFNSTSDDHQISRFIVDCLQATHDRKGLYLGIFVAAEFAGQIRIELRTVLTGHTVCNIAYWIRAHFSGRGITYRALRSVIPFCVNEFWCDKDILQFEAEVNVDNAASQCIVKRLGFRLQKPEDSAGQILDLVAPLSVENWILERDECPEHRLEHAHQRYSEVRDISDSSRTGCMEIISLLTMVDEEEASGNQFSDAKILLASVLPLEERVHSSLNERAPQRVPKSDFRGVSWIELTDIEGVWLEDESGVIIIGHTVVKGCKLQLSKSEDGNFSFGSFILDTCDSDRASFRNVESGLIVEWTRIERSRDSVLHLDGIWKTSRGYVGIVGTTIVTSTCVWRVELSMRAVYLVLSPSFSYQLDSFDIDVLVWRTVELPSRRKKLPYRGNSPISWSRSVGSHLERSFMKLGLLHRMKLLSAIKSRREAEVELLQNFVPHRPKHSLGTQGLPPIQPAISEQHLLSLRSLMHATSRHFRLLHVIDLLRGIVRTKAVNEHPNIIEEWLSKLLDLGDFNSESELIRLLSYSFLSRSCTLNLTDIRCMHACCCAPGTIFLLS